VIPGARVTANGMTFLRCPFHSDTTQKDLFPVCNCCCLLSCGISVLALISTRLSLIRRTMGLHNITWCIFFPHAYQVNYDDYHRCIRNMRLQSATKHLAYMDIRSDRVRMMANSLVLPLYIRKARPQLSNLDSTTKNGYYSPARSCSTVTYVSQGLPLELWVCCVRFLPCFPSAPMTFERHSMRGVACFVRTQTASLSSPHCSYRSCTTSRHPSV